MQVLFGALLEGLAALLMALELPWRWMLRALGVLLMGLWLVIGDQTPALLGGLLALVSFGRWPSRFGLE
ncbi:hypothetical protein [Deinococcus multiflagellatus]|uniref:Uncharacterized protein n=1 Tax=Deinococcus multiflagellatus TaxID=1656887 RepID=A0ABW1ZKW1_9DEIO|nr:hypothetical protein [Deinococcus multiflagellatus]MBZ9712403.1 hypothetical protein [Deinococcus multiflagellatus]